MVGESLFTVPRACPRKRPIDIENPVLHRICSGKSGPERCIMRLAAAGTRLPHEPVERPRSLQHHVYHRAADVVFRRGGIHHLNILEPVNGRGIKQLVKVPNRHIGQFAVEEYGNASGACKSDHPVFVCNSGQIAESLKHVGYRLVLDNRGKINRHRSGVSLHLRPLAPHHDFIQLPRPDAVGAFGIGICRNHGRC